MDAQTDLSLRWAHMFEGTFLTLRLKRQRYSYIYIITKTRLLKYVENFTSKNRKKSDKISDIYRITAQNIDCGYSLEPPCRGGSNEYPQTMFLSRNKKSNIYPCKPQFYYIKVGFKGRQIM